MATAFGGANSSFASKSFSYSNNGLISLNSSLSAAVLSSFSDYAYRSSLRIAFVIGARARISSTVAFRSPRAPSSASRPSLRNTMRRVRGFPVKDGVSGVSISLMVPMTYFCHHVLIRLEVLQISRNAEIDIIALLHLRIAVRETKYPSPERPMPLIQPYAPPFTRMLIQR